MSHRSEHLKQFFPKRNPVKQRLGETIRRQIIEDKRTKLLRKAWRYEDA